MHWPRRQDGRFDHSTGHEDMMIDDDDRRWCWELVVATGEAMENWRICTSFYRSPLVSLSPRWHYLAPEKSKQSRLMRSLVHYVWSTTITMSGVEDNLKHGECVVEELELQQESWTVKRVKCQCVSFVSLLLTACLGFCSVVSSVEATCSTTQTSVPAREWGDLEPLMIKRERGRGRGREREPQLTYSFLAAKED